EDRAGAGPARPASLPRAGEGHLGERHRQPQGAPTAVRVRRADDAHRAREQAEDPGSAEERARDGEPAHAAAHDAPTLSAARPAILRPAMDTPAPLTVTPLAERNAESRRRRRRRIRHLAFPAVLLALGTTGYMAIEGWSVSDPLYMTGVTVTNVRFL